MELPKKVSGRTVTPRGVHMHPSGFHNFWIRQADYWLGLLQDMNMSWVLALSDSDNLRISGAAELLLSAGIIPIVRFNYLLPDRWPHGEEVGRLAELYAKYNAPLIVQFANEPFDDREWRKKRGKSLKPANPDEAWAIIAMRWREAAQEIVRRGGVAGFPDGPCYDRNPFAVIGDDNYFWTDGKAAYLGHFYGKGRPVDYPYDDVTQTGQPLTEEEYRILLDDFYDDPAWREPLEVINEARKKCQPGLTAIDDDVCWRGWEKVLYWSRQTFGFEVPIAMTEGGWVPRDRAGSGNDVDVRWPLTTPNMVAKRTVEMYSKKSPLFAICPWLLACEAMGASGWPFDAWVGWAFAERYGPEKPVVRALKRGSLIRYRVEAARDLVNECLEIIG